MKLFLENSSQKPLTQDLFESILERLPLVIENIHESELELLLTDDKTIQKLNHEFRAKNSPTDVLSFAQRELPKPAQNSASLGQIVISVESAERQAAELSQSLEEELRFLFTHGLLHLLGFDHQNPKEEKLMLEKAYKILGRLPL